MFLSIMGMYEYDPYVFEGFEAPVYIDPDGNSWQPDKLAIIRNIIFNCAELELIYPSIEYMKKAIAVWTVANMDSWNKLYASQMVKYNPIWNVDANESESETTNRDISRQHTGANNETVNLSDAETVNITDTESVQGFNSNQWSESKRNVKSGTDTINHTGTDNTAITNNETVDDDNERVLTKRRTGNIGVTATQDLIKKEREIANFNIIDHITQSFKERFCLMVY